LKTRILLVDDDQSVLDSYRRSLRDQFDVDVALGGQHGLDSIRVRGPYIAIVSDFRMPGMDGISFLARVREICPETFRLLLTGVRDVPNGSQAIRDGVVYCSLAKPCPAALLSELLTYVLPASPQPPV
jgi:DNA-binding NtrC family response regulator